MKWIVQFFWFLSIILVSYLSLTPHIQIPYEFSGADKLAHFLAYLWLGILPFFGFARLRAALTGALLMILLGVGLEFAQSYVPGRNFSVADMAADCAGVVSGIFLAKQIKKALLSQGLSRFCWWS
jgi:VanZ family protein